MSWWQLALVVTFWVVVWCAIIGIAVAVWQLWIDTARDWREQKERERS